MEDLSRVEQSFTEAIKNRDFYVWYQPQIDMRTGSPRGGEALVRWHNTKEQFTVEEFIHANCAYPGNWNGVVKRIENIGSLIITVTQVYMCDRSLSFHAVSLSSFLIDQTMK